MLLDPVHPTVPSAARVTNVSVAPMHPPLAQSDIIVTKETIRYTKE